MYFNLKEHIFKRYNIKEDGCCILCINAERNIGKTTAVFNYLFNEENPKVDINNKILIIRNNGEQIKTAKQDFNARMMGKYQIWGNLVFKTITNTSKNGDITYSRGEHIGYVGSLTQFTNMKSVEAKNVRYVFFDEYAEVSSLNVYDAFISMLKTFERFNKIMVIMLGNRESLNNEWMLKWNVLPSEHNFTEDRFVQFSPRGYFFELGSNQFQSLGNHKTLSNELAKFDDKADNYLNHQGYKRDVTLDVKSFNSLKIKEYKYGIAFKMLPLAFVELEDGSFALIENHSSINYLEDNNFAILAIDELSYTLKQTTRVTYDTREKLIKQLIELWKNNLLYFDSFNGLYTIRECSRYYRM